MSLIPFEGWGGRQWDSPWGGWSMYPHRHTGLGHSGRHRQPLGTLDTMFTDMDRELENMERQMQHAFRRLGWPRGGGTGDLSLFSPYIERETEGEEMQPGKYSMNVHLGNNIEPRDVKVSLKDGMMTVEAKKEYKSDDGCSRMYQEYMRKFTLPENIKMSEVKTVLTPEGDLHIEAPLPQQALPEPRQPQEIPIKKA